MKRREFLETDWPQRPVRRHLFPDLHSWAAAQKRPRDSQFRV